MACIFLSAKVEESPKKVRDVINVAYHISQKREQGIPKPDPIDTSKQVLYVITTITSSLVMTNYYVISYTGI